MKFLNKKQARIVAIILVFILFGAVILFRYLLGLTSEIISGKTLFPKQHVSAESFLDFGDDALHDRRTAMATDIFEVGVKYFPHDANLWRALANSQEAIGHLDKSILSWEKYLQLSPGNASDYAHVADLMYRQEQYGLALKEMEKAIEKDRSRQNWIKYAQLLNLNKKFYRAEKVYETLRDLDPEDQNWAFAKKWTASNPVSSQEFLTRLSESFAQKDTQKQQELLQQYQILFGNTLELQIFLTEETYLGILRNQPNNAEAWYQLANFYDKFNRYQKAEDAINQALKLSPNNIQYLAYAAYIALKLQQWQKANVIYQDILKLEPNSLRYNKEYELLKEYFPLTSEDVKT